MLHLVEIKGLWPVSQSSAWLPGRKPPSLVVPETDVPSVLANKPTRLSASEIAYQKRSKYNLRSQTLRGLDPGSHLASLGLNSLIYTLQLITTSHVKRVK